MYRSMAEVHGYRCVEYTTFETKPGEWKWVYYPKVGFGIRTEGTLKGTQAMAIAACWAAIDAWLGPKARPASGST